MLSFQHLQAGLQLAFGFFVVALLVFIRRWETPYTCLSATLFFVASVSLSADHNVGTRLLGVSSLIGATWLGALMGGVLLTAAREMVGDAQYDTGVLLAVTCSIAVLVLAPLSASRMSRGPPITNTLGMVTIFLFNIVLVQGFVLTSTRDIWIKVISYLFADVVLGAGMAALCSLLVMPTLAADEARGCLVKALKEAGALASRYSSQLLNGPQTLDPFFNPGASTLDPPSDASTPPTPTSMGTSSHMGRSNISLETLEGDISGEGGGSKWPLGNDELQERGASPFIEDGEVDQDTYLEMLRAVTAPPTSTVKKLHRSSFSVWALNLLHASHHGSGEESHEEEERKGEEAQKFLVNRPVQPVATLGPFIARARACLVAAAVEPPLLTGQGRFDAVAWSHLCDCLKTLVTQLAALESILDSPPQLWRTDLSMGVGDSLRVVMARVAASCASLSAFLESPASGAQFDETGMKLARQMSEEAAEVARLSCSHLSMFGQTWEDSRDDLRVAVHSYMLQYWENVRTAEAPTIKIKTAHTVRQLIFFWSLCNGLVGTMEEVEAAVMGVTVKLCKRQDSIHDQRTGSIPEDNQEQGVPGNTRETHASSGLARKEEHASLLRSLLHLCQLHCSFLLGLLNICLAVPLLKDLMSTFTQLPTTIRRALPDQLHSRQFQAGVKYWLCSSCSLILVYVLMQVSRDAREAVPVFTVATASLCASEKVEATVTKISFWVGGTVIGGTLGYVMMVHPSLANNPYGLMAVLCVFTFLVGALGAGSHYRMAITLTFMTLCAIVLCQYKGCCETTGSVRYYLNRVVAVLLGCLLAVLFSNLILPWYNSSWALEVMADAFVQASKMVEEMYQVFYMEGGVAAAKYGHTSRGTAQSLLLATRSLLEPKKIDGGSNFRGAEGTGGMQAPRPLTRDQAYSIEGSYVTGSPSFITGRNLKGEVDPEAGHTARQGSQQAAFGPLSEAPVGVLEDDPRMTPAVLAPSYLQSRVAQPLVQVQVALNRDAVVWKRGVLATPPVVPHVLRGMMALLDRLAALQLTLVAPAVSGHFNGGFFVDYIEPMHGKMITLMERLHALTAACADHLRCDKCDPDSQAVIRQHIGQLEEARLDVRHLVLRLRRRHHYAMKRAEDPAYVQYHSHPDDGVRFLSFLYALVKYLDKATMVARVVETSGTQGRSGWRYWVR